MSLFIGYGIPILLVATAAYVLFWDRTNVVSETSARPSANDVVNSPDDFIPVEEAVRLAHDKLYDTAWGGTVQGWNRSGEFTEDAQIALVARVLSHDIQLYGIEPLSAVYRPVKTDSIEITMAEWVNRGSVLRRMNKKDTLYSQLAFKRGELERFISNQRQSDAPPSIPSSGIGSAPRDEDFMPLQEAARALYEDARKRNRYLAIAAERLSGGKGGQITNGTPEDVLDFVATYIGGKAQIYGTRPPSDRKELISAPEVARSSFESGACILKNDRHVYTGLEIPKSQLHKLLLGLQVSEL